MNKRPAISVIVPIWSVEKYIERCARSLFEQSFKDIEYIFINDSTPDNSMKILNGLLEEYEECRNRTKIINNSTNLGIARTRNIGLEAATAEYVIFADSDDWVDKDMYERMYERAISCDADIVWCDFLIHQIVHGQERTFYSSEQVRECSSSAVIKGLLSSKLFGSMCIRLVRRNLYINNHISYLEGTNRSEDLNVSIKLYYYTQKISYINVAFYHYNQSNPSSLVRHFDVNRAADDQVRNADNLINFLKDDSNIYAEELVYYKVDSKAPLAYSNKLSDISKWRDIFPECNSQILKNPYISTRRKFRFLLIKFHIQFFFPPCAQSFFLRCLYKVKSWIR
jgi:glycosyltransferase involved in cell wall biosynthesis